MSSETAHALEEFDVFSEQYELHQAEMWAQLRAGGCPVAHTDRWGGAWMLVKYDDIRGALHDTTTYSSRSNEIAGAVPPAGTGLVMPPVTIDPPFHRAQRDLLAPFFTPARALALEPFVRNLARQLATGLAERGDGDAMADFAQPLALSVLTHILAAPHYQERFADWPTRIMRLGPTDEKARAAAMVEIFRELGALLDERARAPGDDLVSYLLQASIDGQPLTRKQQIGSLVLFAMAGADTTWSTLGASLWYLAGRPDERSRLIADPQLLRTTAIEELLRVFSPVTLARVTTQATELHGRCPHAGERLILPLGAANRDPDVFDAPDEIRLDRKRNGHISFGSGPHICLGMHLARLELRVGLEEWLKAVPEFEMADATPLRWSRGQTRGPEAVRIRIPGAT